MFFFRRRWFFYSIHRGVKLIGIGIFVLLLIIMLALTTFGENEKKVYGMIISDRNSYIEIISDILPIINCTGANQSLPQLWIRQGIYTITGFNSHNPAEIVGRELNISYGQAVTGQKYIMASKVEEENGEEDYYLPGQDERINDWIVIPDESGSSTMLDGEPVVLIYNTHNAEAYKPTDGVSRLEGKNAGIASVAKGLARNLESQYLIKTFYCDVIHDYPDFTKAYNNSMSTLQQLLKKYPKAQLVLDIHRDAGLSSRSDTLVKIGDKYYAKIMIVIGTEHEKWQENLAFAEKLEARSNKLYPGLIKCIRIRKDRRYNQHLHPRALLLEFGSDLNTQEDAANSAVLLAEIIQGILKDGQQ